MWGHKKYEAIVMGGSAGGFAAFSALLKDLPAEYPIPIVLVQHRGKDAGGRFEEVLQSKCRIRIKQADEKERIVRDTVYVAPPNYHLLIETDRTFSLSSDAPVKFSRPSIDVLFESAAICYEERLVGIIVSGASNDGAEGITAIRKYGGLTIAQSPDEAQFPLMTEASIKTGKIDHIGTLSAIRDFLMKLSN